MVQEADFEALANRLTDPNNELQRGGQVLSGTSASDAGKAMLIRDYGSEEVLIATMRRGRPRVGDRARGDSPTVRGRISDEDYEAFKQLEAQTGKKQSELVREAVHLLLTQHRLAS